MAARRRTGSTWRDADLRGGSGIRPTSVASVVRRTHLGLSAARWGESVLLGVAALCLMLAVARIEGVGPGSLEIWSVALLAGALAGASWRLAHRLDEHEVARAIDRRLRHRGALLTAYEIEQRDVRTPLARILCARVLGRLRTREALQALAPPLALPLVAPLAAAALLALVLERNRADGTAPPVDMSAAVQELEGLAVQALAARDEGAVDSATVRELITLRRRVESLAGAVGRGEKAPEKTLEEIEALDRELGALVPRVRRDPEIAGRLEAGRPYLDAARMGLSGSRREPGAGEGEIGGESGGASLTGGEGHGTMTGSSDPGTHPETVAEPRDPSDERAASEAGSIAGSWWAEEYDEIVARWIEILRDEHREHDRSPNPDGG